MTPHINLPVDHSEMASYKRRFASVINAIFAKALINAEIYKDLKFVHKKYSYWQLRAWSGFLGLHRPFSQKKQGLNLIILTLLYSA